MRVAQRETEESKERGSDREQIGNERERESTD